MQTKEGKFLIQSYLIGISYNNGEKWYFIDTSNKDLELLRTILPEISTKLTLPENALPLLIKE